jgi:hypothetical protein
MAECLQLAKMAKNMFLTLWNTVHWSLNLGGGMVIDTRLSTNLRPLREACAGILEQSMEARNPVRTELSYWQARLHRLEELIPGLLKGLKMPPQVLLTNVGAVLEFYNFITIYGG